jgi:hypothetical protein
MRVHGEGVRYCGTENHLEREMVMQSAMRFAHRSRIKEDELRALIRHGSERIKRAAAAGEPAPFLTYRNRKIFEIALRIRTTCDKPSGTN